MLERPKRILLAVDGSPDSQAAAGAVALLALRPDTQVLLLNVVPDTRRDTSRSRDLLALVAARLPSNVATRLEIARGDVASAILERAAMFEADVILLGAGRSPRWPLRGSTAERVLAAAHCSVLIARATDRVKTEVTAPTGAARELATAV
jgi:nucleotide-binding universal stress UspA family protein